MGQTICMGTVCICVVARSANRRYNSGENRPKMTVRADFSPDVPLSADEFRETGASDTERSVGRAPSRLTRIRGSLQAGADREAAAAPRLRIQVWVVARKLLRKVT